MWPLLLETTPEVIDEVRCCVHETQEKENGYGAGSVL